MHLQTLTLTTHTPLFTFNLIIQSWKKLKINISMPHIQEQGSFSITTSTMHQKNSLVDSSNFTLNKMLISYSFKWSKDKEIFFQLFWKKKKSKTFQPQTTNLFSNCWKHTSLYPPQLVYDVVSEVLECELALP